MTVLLYGLGVIIVFCLVLSMPVNWQDVGSSIGLCKPRSEFDKEFERLHDAWYDGYISNEKFALMANECRRRHGVPERDYDRFPVDYRG